MILKKEDRRYVTTDKRIIEAFWDLLEKVGYQKVSVSAIVKHAAINRSTFYEHFLDKEDLMASIQTELIRQVMADLPEVTIYKLTDKSLIEARLNLLFKGIYDRKKPFKLLLSQQSDGLFVGRFASFSKQFLIDAKLIDVIDIPEDYVFSIFESMMFNLIKTWIERDFIETPEAFSKIVGRVTPKLMQLLIS